MNRSIRTIVVGGIAAAAVVLGIAACEPVDGDTTVTGNSVQTSTVLDTATATDVDITTTTDAGTVTQQQAIASAEDYIATMPFSRTGLIEQLEYEQFSTADATYAVDSLNIDYNEQAAKSAQQYLDSVGGFSHGELVDQLVYEGYTAEQAEHGVTAVGL